MNVSYPNRILVIALAVSFIITYSVGEIFVSEFNAILSGVLFSLIYLLTYFIVAAIMLKGDPRIWLERSTWYKINIASLGQEFRASAAQEVKRSFAFRLLLEASTAAAVGAANGVIDRNLSFIFFMAASAFAIAYGFLSVLLTRESVNPDR